MSTTTDDLRARGFRRAGTVHPAGGMCRVEIDWDIQGFAIYAMVVGDEVKKFGTTGRKNSGFRSRMTSTFSALRQVIRRGPPYLGDPFKRFAPAAILAGHTVELWARGSTAALLEIEESELNQAFRPEWTKEGEATRQREAKSDE